MPYFVTFRRVASAAGARKLRGNIHFCCLKYRPAIQPLVTIVKFRRCCLSAAVGRFAPELPAIYSSHGGAAFLWGNVGDSGEAWPYHEGIDDRGCRRAAASRAIQPQRGAATTAQKQQLTSHRSSVADSSMIVGR